MIPTDTRTSIYERARQFILFVREVKSICQKVSSEIAAGIKAANLVTYQSQLAAIDGYVKNWQFGSLTDANIRAEIAAQFPGSYASAADVATDMTALNTDFTNLMTEIENVLAAARANGQFYDVDPTTHQLTYVVLISPATDTLLSLVNTVISGIN